MDTAFLFKVKVKLALVDYVRTNLDTGAAITTRISNPYLFPWPKWNILKQIANCMRNAFYLHDNKEVDCATDIERLKERTPAKCFSSTLVVSFVTFSLIPCLFLHKILQFSAPDSNI